MQKDMAGCNADIRFNLSNLQSFNCILIPINVKAILENVTKYG